MKTKTKISLLRAGVIHEGIKATLSMTKDHAPLVFPTFKKLVKDAPKWGFKEWRVGNLVQGFHTDISKYKMRLFKEKGEYVGLTVFKKKGYKEIKVASFYHDESVTKISKQMKSLALV